MNWLKFSIATRKLVRKKIRKDVRRHTLFHSSRITNILLRSTPIAAMQSVDSKCGTQIDYGYCLFNANGKSFGKLLQTINFHHSLKMDRTIHFVCTAFELNEFSSSFNTSTFYRFNANYMVYSGNACVFWTWREQPQLTHTMISKIWECFEQYSTHLNCVHSNEGKSLATLENLNNFLLLSIAKRSVVVWWMAHCVDFCCPIQIEIANYQYYFTVFITVNVFSA